MATNQVQYTVEMTIPEGQTGEFKRLAQGAINLVKANEPKMLSSEWYISDNGRQCYVVERYSEADGIPAHIKNLGRILTDLIKVSPITRFKVFGTISDEIKNTLTPLGAKFFPAWNGMTR